MARPTKSSRLRSPFSQRIERVRLRTGLNQEDFATALGLRGETYRRYERGETEPSVETLAKIRRFTGIDLNHLVAGEPDLFIATDRHPPHKVKKIG